MSFDGTFIKISLQNRSLNPLLSIQGKLQLVWSAKICFSSWDAALCFNGSNYAWFKEVYLYELTYLM